MKSIYLNKNKYNIILKRKEKKLSKFLKKNRVCNLQFTKRTFIVYLNNKMFINFNFDKNLKEKKDIIKYRTWIPFILLYRFGLYSNIKYKLF